MGRVQRGDRAAYDELYARWRLPLFHFLLGRTCSRQNAEEALQETWIRVYRHRQTYNKQRAFRSWIFRVAANAGYDAQRLDTSEIHLEESMLTGIIDGRDVLQTRDTLFQALHSLSGQDRQILMLSGVGFSSHEVAEILEMSASTVRTRIQRSRSMLREAFNG